MGGQNDLSGVLPGFESVPTVNQDEGRFSVWRAYCQARVKRAGRGRRGLDPRRVLSVAMETEVRNRLIDLGYIVTGTRHKEHFDLLASGVRIEVKAAMWDGRRYGAALRASDADVLVIGCLGESLGFFVVPFGLVRGLSYVKITSQNLSDYGGRLAQFLEAWGVVSAMVQVGVNAWQLPLI